MEFPVVTFLSASYNHAKYLIQSLEGVRAQTYPNIQHIIIDDASSDNSVELIETWINKTNHQCTFIRHSSNKGISYSLNESIELMKGDLWTCCPTDDIVFPTRTKKFVNYMISHPDVGMVISDMSLINDKGTELELNGTSSFIKNVTLLHPNFSAENFGAYDSLLFSNYIPGSLMIRKNVFSQVGLFDEKMQMEDWGMWLKIASQYQIGFINEILASYRKHDKSSLLLQPEKMRRSMFITFFNQREFCYSSNRKKLFKQAYIHHFSNYYNPFKYRTSSFIFHRVNWFLFIKALIKRVGIVIRNFSTRLK